MAQPLPLVLADMVLVEDSGRWWLQDAAGPRLPVVAGAEPWPLLALSGGAAATVVARGGRPRAPDGGEQRRAGRGGAGAAVTAWQELVATALVGTERRPLSQDVVAGVEAALGAELPAMAPELSVVTAAAVLAARRRVGWMPPQHDGRSPPPAPPDDRPVAPATATCGAKPST